MEYEAYVNLIRHLDDLVARLCERHPDPATREQVVALLNGLDALHREGLRRLVEALRDAGGGTLLDQVAADPVIETLLGLYDLAELNLPEPGAREGFPREHAGFIPLESLTEK